MQICNSSEPVVAAQGMQRFAPMKRLLRESELDLEGAPRLRMRTQRARIFRGYLKMLRGDLRRLMAERREAQNAAGQYDFAALSADRARMELGLFALSLAPVLYELHIPAAAAMAERMLRTVGSTFAAPFSEVRAAATT